MREAAARDEPGLSNAVLLFQALPRQRDRDRCRRARLRAAVDARCVVDLRLRRRHARPVGFAAEVPAHRALQILSRTCMAAAGSRHAARAANARAPSLSARRISLAGGNAAVARGEAPIVVSTRLPVLLVNPRIV